VPEFPIAVAAARPIQRGPVKSVLVICHDTRASTGLLNDLKSAGAHVVGATSCETLVQDSIRYEADLVLAMDPASSAELFAATAVLANAHPIAVVVFTDDISVESMERALDSGIHAWVVRGYRPERLRAILQLAQLRFAREREQSAAYGQMRQHLEERKLVDRAKGILMERRAMAEPEAFETLRAAAMHRKERLGQVAQRLIDAARNAEGMNRAGQLRMLSQRLVKLHLLEALGVDAAGAAALRQASIARGVQNLDMLAGLLSRATFGDLLAKAAAAWSDLEHALCGAAAPDGAPAIDAVAETLLAAAEMLTAALESASPGARTQLINLSGRQRMLSQRYAKLALLRSLGGAAEQIATAAQLHDIATTFEQTLESLRGSSLTSASGLAILQSAAKAWSSLRVLADTASAQSRLTIAQCSEELLEQFDRLTEDYGRSIKVLVS